MDHTSPSNVRNQVWLASTTPVNDVSSASDAHELPQDTNNKRRSDETGEGAFERPPEPVQSEDQQGSWFEFYSWLKAHI